MAFDLPMFRDTYLLEAINAAGAGTSLSHALWNPRLARLQVLDCTNEPLYEAAAHSDLKTGPGLDLAVRAIFFDAVVGRLDMFHTTKSHFI